MIEDAAPRNLPVSKRPHPFIYRFIFGLALLLVLSAWGFFGDKDHAGLMLAVVSVFVFISVVIPSVLWRIGGKRRELDATVEARLPFRDWTAGEFEIWQGQLKGKDAAIAILLPTAAVCLDMTVLAIVLHFTTAGGL